MKEINKIIGAYQRHSLDDVDAFSLVERKTEMPTGHDLLVRIAAVSVNPVDVGVYAGIRRPRATPKILGWDAVGTVVAVGEQVSLFDVGQRVFYAGDFRRDGSDQTFQLVDERIVGHAPEEFSDEDLAGLPLTSLTAYEALFEQMHLSITDIEHNRQKTLLIINGAGGVGSIATQLASHAGLRVIATASNPQSIAWVQQHGAGLVVDHHQDLVEQVHALGIKNVDYILGLSRLDEHFNEMAGLIRPSGTIVSITENRRPIDLKKLTKKRATFAWEWMYSKSYYQTDDMITQHEILDQIGQLLRAKVIVPTTTKVFTGLNPESLRQAFKLVAGGHMIGKVVIKAE